MSYVQGAQVLVTATAASLRPYATLRVRKPSGTIYEQRVTSGLDPLTFSAGIDTSDEPGIYEYQFTIGKTIKKRKFTVRAGVPAGGSVVVPPPPPPSAPPPAIANQGYHLAFEDTFDTLNRDTWDDHIWYDESPNPLWDGFQEVVDGQLHQRTKRSHIWVNPFAVPPEPSTGSYPNNTLTTFTSGIDFLYGYFEARMQWTDGKGAWPGFWLFSRRHATNPAYPNINPYCAEQGLNPALCYGAELDIFEGQGGPPFNPAWPPSNQFYFATLHRNSPGIYGQVDDTNPAENSWQGALVNLTLDFHKYACLWTPDQIIWYLDNRELTRWPTYDSTNQPMFMLLDMWRGGWMWDISDDPAETPDTLECVWDSIRVWQK